MKTSSYKLLNTKFTAEQTDQISLFRGEGIMGLRGKVAKLLYMDTMSKMGTASMPRA